MTQKVLFALTVLALPSRAVDFAKDVQPILAQRCLSCHNESAHMGNLRLDSRAAAERVLTSGPLLRKVSGQEKTTMPPVGAPRQ